MNPSWIYLGRWFQTRLYHLGGLFPTPLYHLYSCRRTSVGEITQVENAHSPCFKINDFVTDFGGTSVCRTASLIQSELP